MEDTPEPKFISFNKSRQEIPNDYGKVYKIEDDGRRIKIAASKNQIDLILKLTGTLDPPFYILYILVVTRLGNEHGRYQSPLIETKDELVDFLLEYKQYFETDGRHHIWIGTINNSGRLIYDQHDVIFAYGPLSDYISVLTKEGFKEKEFSFP